MGVEVASRGDLTSNHFQFIAHPVAVGVVDARAVALIKWLCVGAFKPGRRGIGGFSVVVAGRFILTTRDLQFVANTIAIGVSLTIAIAVERWLRIHAASIIEADCRVVVARARVVASKRQACGKVARRIADRGFRVVVARQINHAAGNFFVVANAVVVII